MKGMMGNAGGGASICPPPEICEDGWESGFYRSQLWSKVAGGLEWRRDVAESLAGGGVLL